MAPDSSDRSDSRAESAPTQRDRPGGATTVVLIERVPPEARRRGRAMLVLARALGVTVAEVTPALAAVPWELPRRFSPGEGDALVRALCALELDARARPALGPPGDPCREHPALCGEGRCPRCEESRCRLCAAASARGLCRGCERRAARRRRWFRLRVAVLLAVLAVVMAWAAADGARRRARTRWERPLRIAVVLLRHGEVDDDAVAALIERVPALAARLREEAARHRALDFAPFAFEVLGPVDVASPPPRPRGEDWLSLGRYAFELWRYRRGVDGPAGLYPRAYDAVIYAWARPPRSEGQRSVEGMSQDGGRFASVEVELTREMADYALFVVAHELMHTLGASDKYDSAGRTRIPDGLPEPERVPLLPQDRAEVMARSRVVAASEERVPETLEELGVGPLTAREIGWTR